MGRNHCAIDLVAPEGDNVYAPFTGVVKYTKPDGNRVIDIEATATTSVDGEEVANDFHGFWVRLLYVSPTVHRGEKVCAGQLVGRMIDITHKCQANTMVNHLHLELYQSPYDGLATTRLNPTNYLRQAEERVLSDPVALNANCDTAVTQFDINAGSRSYVDASPNFLSLYSLGYVSNDQNDDRLRNDGDTDDRETRNEGNPVLFSACFPVYWIIDVCVGFRCVHSALDYQHTCSEHFHIMLIVCYGWGRAQCRA